MRKSIFVAIVAAVMCIGLFAGCSGTEQQQNPSSSTSKTEAKHQIVCATFPAYDWTMQVLGDRAGEFKVTYLMGSGVDLHSFQPTVEDMGKIADADLFVYVGGESDEWAADAIEAAGNPNLHSVSLLEAVGDAAVEEEVVEGMQAEEEEEAGAGEEEPEYDEHVWLSLRNAQTLTDAIAAELAGIDPSGADAYAANAAAYKGKLAELDARYAETVAAASGKTLVFADRFPFRYLADDYSLAYYAAFVGCSAETEASFETVAFLAQKLDELGLGSVLVIEGSDQKIAETVIKNTKAGGQQILVVDSLQSVTDSDISGGKTYLSAMEKNLSVLTTALS